MYYSAMFYNVFFLLIMAQLMSYNKFHHVINKVAMFVICFTPTNPQGLYGQ